MTSRTNSSLPSDWNLRILGEDTEIKGRIGWRGYKRTDLRNSGPIVVGGVNVKSQIHLDFSDITYLSREKYEESPEIQLRPTDVLLVQRGNGIGQVGYFDGSIPEATINPTLIILSNFIGDPRFLFYYLVSPQGQSNILSRASGSSIPALYQKSLKSLKYPSPPPEEQRAIAHILGSLDDKIELNRRMNATLEAMARAIFQSWFVDFDPVHAKARGEQPSGMDADTAALFPDSFEESEVGMIPAGWRVGTVGDEFDITMGQSPPGSTYNEEGEGLPFYQGRSDFGFRYPSRHIYCTEPKRLAEKDDTLVSVRAPVGDINMALEECCIGRGVAAIRHKSGNQSYTYYAMDSLSVQFEKFEAEGTVFGSISGENFRNMQFLTPPLDIVSCFENLIYPIDQLIEINEIQTLTLAGLRDALLPRLISGELRVPDLDNWHSSLDETYGSLADDPIQRQPQGEYEEWDALE